MRLGMPEGFWCDRPPLLSCELSQLRKVAALRGAVQVLGLLVEEVETATSRAAESAARAGHASRSARARQLKLQWHFIARNLPTLAMACRLLLLLLTERMLTGGLVKDDADDTKDTDAGARAAAGATAKAVEGGTILSDAGACFPNAVTYTASTLQAQCKRGAFKLSLARVAVLMAPQVLDEQEQGRKMRRRQKQLKKEQTQTQARELPAVQLNVDGTSDPCPFAALMQCLEDGGMSNRARRNLVSIPCYLAAQQHCLQAQQKKAGQQQQQQQTAENFDLNRLPLPEPLVDHCSMERVVLNAHVSSTESHLLQRQNGGTNCAGARVKFMAKKIEQHGRVCLIFERAL